MVQAHVKVQVRGSGAHNVFRTNRSRHRVSGGSWSEREAYWGLLGGLEGHTKFQGGGIRVTYIRYNVDVLTL